MANTPTVKTKRAYDEYSEEDGYRVLIDRLWPRGVSKEDAKLDEWCKQIAPSNELRKWFDHDPDKFESFREQYKKELQEKREELKRLANIASEQTLTLIYGAKDRSHNHAIVLKEQLEQITDE